MKIKELSNLPANADTQLYTQMRRQRDTLISLYANRPDFRTNNRAAYQNYQKQLKTLNRHLRWLRVKLMNKGITPEVLSEDNGPKPLRSPI